MRRGRLAPVTIVALVLALTGLAGAGPVRAQEQAAFGANPVGVPVAIYDADGDEIARVTVRDVVDPFEDYADLSGPSRGERFVLAAIEIENTGERPYGVTGNDFYLLDTLGRAASPGLASRSEESLDDLPDLETTDLTPGETAGGAVVYRVAEDAELVQLYYSFSGEIPQLYLLADLTGGGDGGAAGDEDDPGGTAAGGDSAAATGETPRADDADADADETPGGDTGEADPDAPSAADCAWAVDTLDRLNALAPAGEELQGMDDDADPERLREIAADLAAAADEQRDSAPPTYAEEASDQIAAALGTYADALEVIAAALDAGDEPDTVALLADVRAANRLIDEAGAVTAPLLAGCETV